MPLPQNFSVWKFVFELLRVKPWTFCIIDKCSTTESHPAFFFFLLMGLRACKASFEIQFNYTYLMQFQFSPHSHFWICSLIWWPRLMECFDFYIKVVRWRLKCPEFECRTQHSHRFIPAYVPNPASVSKHSDEASQWWGISVGILGRYSAWTLGQIKIYACVCLNLG
jgi:hypothetical protein